MKRRDAVKIIGVAGGLAAGGCAQKSAEKVVPYLNEPDNIVPGEPVWYATTCRECPAGCGMLAKTMDGRPIKLEGNPEHPVNLGALCPRGQAALQRLYHPKRFKGPMLRKNGELTPISWDEAIGMAASAVEKSKKTAFLTGAVTGSLASLIDKWLEYFGAPGRLTYELLGSNAWRKANGKNFGMAEIPAVKIDEAGFLLGFGADFLEIGTPVEHARMLARAREKWGEGKARFIAFDSRLSLTAANADEWIPIVPGSAPIIASAIINIIASRRGVGTLWAPLPGVPKDIEGATGVSESRLRKIAEAFADNTPSLAMAAGMGIGAEEAWAAVNMLNAQVGNVNRTVLFGTGTGADWGFYPDLKNLADRMDNRDVDTLFVHNVDPVSCMPEGDKLAQAAEKVPMVIQLSPMPDETTRIANLVLPIHHFLESWGDYQPRNGIVGLVQPATRTLYDTRDLKDLLIEIVRKTDGGMADDIRKESLIESARQFWETKLWWKSASGESWDDVRRRGGLWGDGEVTAVQAGFSGQPPELGESPAPKDGGKLMLLAIPSSMAYDGRGEALPWLAECPDPMSKISWDGWVELHPDTAGRLDLKTGSVAKVESEYGGGEWPVWITEGIRPDSAAIPVGINAGAKGALSSNPMRLLPREPGAAGEIEWSVPVSVVPAGRPHKLAYMQGSDSQHHRGFGMDTEQRAHHEAVELWKEKHQRVKPPRKDMYLEHNHPDYRWGMAIDLDRCIGCSACVVACYAENNLPVVGHDLDVMRREMAWMRIERYYEVENGSRGAIFVPMLCQQCDDAPCETVCPVFAAYHTPEGLNAQIYNRCVGTRYCSNNCPYKARRFNFFTYRWPEPLNMQLNPDVTVREKGVMEKCNFCVQRIVAAKMKAKREGRKVLDGEITPACAQTCPTGAIIFGNLKDPESKVAIMSKSKRGYHVLEELNTKPAVTYLKRVKRPGMKS